MNRVLVTGAGGFIGRRVVADLLRQGLGVRAAVRERCSALLPNACTDVLETGDLGAPRDWTRSLTGIDIVVHLAGLAHRQASPAEYRRVNVRGTAALAQAAWAAGVKRFVFVSSIGVLGRATAGVPFDETTPPRPIEPYAVSKLEAEQLLHDDCGDLELVVVRPPLVYGPGNPGNFMHLLRLCASGLPLPLGGVVSRRSLIFVGNLADALIRCALVPRAAGRTYLVSDGEDVTLPELINMIRHHMGMSARLVSVPAGLLWMGERVPVFGARLRKLTESLVVDSRRIRDELGWRPPVSLAEGVASTVGWFRRTAV